jgi:hypothetical protein
VRAHHDEIGAERLGGVHDLVLRVACVLLHCVS